MLRLSGPAFDRNPFCDGRALMGCLLLLLILAMIVLAVWALFVGVGAGFAMLILISGAILALMLWDRISA
jgi:hypothetical protein